MRALVTGAAGFIGSTLTDRLLADGHQVVGIDCLTDYYDVTVKRHNLAGAREHPGFIFVDTDVLTADLTPLLDGVDVAFHQAAQPGVRMSWAAGFGAYVERNVLATQRLLEAAAHVDGLRFVYASSSSVYGDVTGPMDEDAVPRPYSPYGVTKLAGEHLCGLYAQNKAVDTVALRYFTVYGPRQRPDMAIHQFVECALDGRPVGLFGSGEQIRDFTYVDDVVEANILAAAADLAPGTVCNVSGGATTSVLSLLDLVGAQVGTPVVVEHQAAAAGDVSRTEASSTKLRMLVDWQPSVDLREGVARQVAWHRARRRSDERVPASASASAS